MDVASTFLDLVRPLVPRARLAVDCSGTPSAHQARVYSQLDLPTKPRRRPTAPLAALRVHFSDDDARDSVVSCRGVRLEVRVGRFREHMLRRLAMLASLALVYVLLTLSMLRRSRSGRTRPTRPPSPFSYYLPVASCGASAYGVRTF